MASTSPEHKFGVGDRFRIGEDYGTIMFIGEVSGTSGSWLGVEWDNGAKRGRHSGERNGVSYFTCRTPNSGSFLRPNTPNIITGVDFSTILLERYIDNRRTNGQDSVVLGSSNGAIVVEAPRLDGVRTRISQVERLKRISLDNCDVSVPGDLAHIMKLCPSVQSLNLSHTLLSSWEDVVDIVRQMPRLTTLELNLNRLRFRQASKTRHMLKLTHLRLNSTMMTWAEALHVLSIFPELQDLQLGYNQLQELPQSTYNEAGEILQSLTTLNLDSNLLENWASLMQTCAKITNLQNLMVPSNTITSIPLRSEDILPLPQICRLSIADNSITNWNDINTLADWLPNLKELSVTLEHFISTGTSSTTSRDFVIARLSGLTQLNGTNITERERSDAELFYLSWISKHAVGPESDIEAQHPRWKELSKKHQTTREEIKPTTQNLESNMITISIVRLQGPVEKGISVSFVPPAIDLRVLPTMSTKVFIMKLKKTLKIKAQIEPEKIWIASITASSQLLALRPFDSDLLREIAWSGVENGSCIGLVE